MDDKKGEKKEKKFFCIFCDYSTSDKTKFSKHNLTLKHKNLSQGLQKDDKKGEKGETDKKKDNDKKLFICTCGNKYMYRQGLCKHKKICELTQENNGFIFDFDKKNNSDIASLTKLIMEVIKNNNTLIEQNNELTNKVISIQQQQTNVQINSNNSNSNNTFNLQVFLNEKCKHALNIQEFVSLVKLSLEDLEYTGRKGYVEGISNIVLKNLENLGQYKRPFHCTDSKREVLYIKDNNKWEKEGDDRAILTKAIKTIANENIKNITEWKNKNPDCTSSDSRKNDLYLNIVSNSMSGISKEETDKNISKIISNIAKEIIIEK
jgi:hypothetical protein